jgi:arylsulfatase A-like enzyme
MSGGLDYFTHKDSTGAHDLWEGERESHRPGYLTDLFSGKAVEFIRRTRQPFLLSLHYTAPHWPWETREDEAEAHRIQKIFHTDGGSVHTYARMIRHMDEGIGEVLEALRTTGADENTFVVFTSDNGGERYSDTWPLIGKKMDLLEGGIRVPYIVRWPSRVRAGGTTAQQAITMDWLPTFLEAAGAKADPGYPLDGINLLPVLERPDQVVERDLFWRMKFRAQKAMRSGDWKYLSIEGYEYLFNLALDERERANVAKRYPDRLNELKKKYAAWEASLPPIPEDAKFSLVFGPAELPNPS